MAVRASTATKAKTTKAAAVPAAKAAAGAKTTTPSVSFKQIASHIAETHGLKKRQADEVLAGAVDEVVKHLKKGSKVRIGGLGILQVKKRPARMGRNPATGEQIKIKASKKVSFRASKELKEAV